MIAAFGAADEIEPGIIRIKEQAITGVHITRLQSDGSAKADVEPNKFVVGRSKGSPIVLAPINDLLGLCICEGIEDTLSAHEATGLGGWAAGSASRLPALARAIPNYVESLSLFVDDDLPGRRHAATLVQAVGVRGIEVRQIFPNTWRSEASSAPPPAASLRSH
jgi:hypothetical protein